MDTQKRYIEDRIDELEEEVARLKEENVSLKAELDSQKKILAILPIFNEKLKEISNFNERLREVFKDSKKISGGYDIDFSQNLSSSPNPKTFPTRSNSVIKPTPTKINPSSSNPYKENTPPRSKVNYENTFSQQNIFNSSDTPKENSEEKFNRLNFDESFVEEFNRLSGLSGKDFTDARKTFLKENQVVAFSCDNVSKRMNNPNQSPVFVEVSPVQRGDFWAILIQENTFAVLPNPQNSYNDNLHMERAMVKVFDSNFKPNNTYDKIQVERPALFEKIGNTWTLREKGYLILE